jgi:hypothetical protein
MGTIYWDFPVNIGVHRRTSVRPHQHIEEINLAARHKRPRLPREDRRTGDPGPIDEELLGAYLGGVLTPKQRAAVARYLASHPDALEVLSMASDAMSAERRTR